MVQFCGVEPESVRKQYRDVLFPVPATGNSYLAIKSTWRVDPTTDDHEFTSGGGVLCPHQVLASQRLYSPAVQPITLVWM